MDDFKRYDCKKDFAIRGDSLILITRQLYSAPNPHHDSKPSNEMAFHTKRILVTDTGNDEDGHSRSDIYTVHSHAFLQQSKFNFPLWSFTVSSYRANVQNISCCVKCNI